uniref:Uncharacterized protein n=1 Tax=Romanomermis culicivorax TaxID=13658 RepID=A0A915IB86_ROMCU
MKYTSKMVLVPQDMFDKKSDQNSDNGLRKQMSDFKMELERILKNNDMSAELQYKLYGQLFHRYLKLDEESKKPIEVKLKDGKLNDIYQQSVDIDNLHQKQMKNEEQSSTPNQRGLKNEQQSSDDGRDWLRGLPRAKVKQAEMLLEVLNKSTMLLASCDEESTYKSTNWTTSGTDICIEVERHKEEGSDSENHSFTIITLLLYFRQSAGIQ